MTDSTDAIAALAALGLTRCEAEIYAGLLQLAHDGPVSGYGVAKALGRDPANTTKTLATLARNGAVQVAQTKPCLYLPTPPEQLTTELARRVYDRRDEAVRLLAELGPRVVAGGLYTLRDRDQVWHRCRQLVAAGRDLVRSRPRSDRRITGMSRGAAAGTGSGGPTTRRTAGALYRTVRHRLCPHLRRPRWRGASRRGARTVDPPGGRRQRPR